MKKKEKSRANVTTLLFIQEFIMLSHDDLRTMIYDYNSKLLSHEIETIINYDRELIKKLKKIWNIKKTSVVTTFFASKSI